MRLVYLPLLLATVVATRADLFPKIEASFNLTNAIPDPFDYSVADVRVQIRQPDLTTLQLPAFFDGGTTWRVRHTPSAPGLYQILGVSLNGNTVTANNLQPASWSVGGPTLGPGFVSVDPSNSNRFLVGSSRRYYPVGQNVAWDTSAAVTVTSILGKMGGARENWARIWMDHWDGKNLDWPKVGANFGTLSLVVAQKWDAIISAAEQSGVYFQMTLQHHGQYSSTVDANWSQNPYNSANGGFLINATQFFTNAAAKALTKRKLRYAIARWGYSPSIMAWELFNEVQFTDAAQAGQWAVIGAWHDEMAQFLRSQDPYHHLITTSSDVTQPIWNQCDYYTHHDYPTDFISALRDPQGVPAGAPLKPIFGAEAGSDPTPVLGLHAPLWAGLMGAQSGIAQPWYWDRIEAEGGYTFLKALRDFVLYAGIAEQDALSKSAPHVAATQSSGLVFSPGGGWATATQDTFTVGDVAPDGVGTLPSYLQGNFHRNMTPNGYTFLVNYPPGGGTFSVQIVTIAASGAGLRITVDNTTTNSISFPATGIDQSTNFVLSISVATGSHTVRLWNPGQDWVNLGNITLSPYVPILGAYQVATTNFAALWFWHRTNIYYANASATVTGTFPLNGLLPGNYTATWWDTFAGNTVSNFTFTLLDTNALTIPIPPVLRSLALFVGRPAQAGITPPILVRTMGTNSPPVSLPLIITNAGGLPLSYSLSATGFNAVAYSAKTSTNSGGPIFAWKDISGGGRDLRTNFTALTGASPRDEGIAGPIDIGFSFPFFSGAQNPGSFTQLYVSPNGFVCFSPFGGATSSNTPLPSLQAPTNLIAGFWDDLDLATTGHVYTVSDPIAGTFTLQFQDALIKNTPAKATFQIILKTTGEILLQYKSIGISNTCTVGVQNGAGTAGLQAAWNQNYLRSNFAVRLVPASWFDWSANGGLVPMRSAHRIDLNLNPANLAYGKYSGTLLLLTGDPALPSMSLPIALEVSPIASWRQIHFGSADNSGPAADSADPDGDGLSNIFEYAFNTDPNTPNPSPLLYAIAGAHLTISFKRTHPAPADLTYSYEVADNLSGPWQSGPAYTTQTVVDNLDGTETVTITDQAVIPSPAAHYLRVRISR